MPDLPPDDPEAGTSRVQPSGSAADDDVAACLEDFHRRRALGERPRAEDYAERLVGRVDGLRRVLAMETLVDDALGESSAAPPAYPRPFGEYSLLRELGRGAMGVVYEAVHRPLGRTVALKVLRTGMDTEPAALERFRREARACAMVRHPSIVEVYDAGQVDGQPYYSMALLSGRNLFELARDGELPSPDALYRGFADVADALAALHAAGIVHRDVKPSNILRTEEGRLVLADFGLARTAQSERVTATGQALGTPLYMSPEQLLGRAAEVDGQSDVYGLGAAMYEVFAGRPLFQFEDIGSAMRMILRDRPAPLRTVRPDVDERLERIVLKCLEKEKADRYPDAAALAQDLRNLAEGREVVGRPVSEVTHHVRSARRFVPAAAAALVAIGAATWMFLSRDATLAVSCWPTATIAVNGTDRGRTPFEVQLPPGRHTVTLTLGGFAPRTEVIDLEAGARRDIQRVLIAQTGDDPEALALVGKELEVAMANLEPLTSTRGGDVPDVLLVWPRGEVRAEDAQVWRADLSESWEGSGKLQFLSGATLLAEVAFNPERMVTEAPMPDAVRTAMRPGATFEWRLVPESGAAVSATFTVTRKELGPRFTKIAERTSGQPGVLAAHLRAQILLDAGLPLAAYREARGIADAEPRAARAWVLAQHALDRLGLRESALWNEVTTGEAEARAQRGGRDGR